MVLSRIRSGTATMAPTTPHIQPSSAIETNTAMVLRAQRRLTNVGVRNCDSATWMTVSTTGTATMRGQSSNESSATRVTSAINAARADLQLAQNELDRAMQLVSRGFISKADVDRKTATRDSARARVSIADAQLRELRARTARLDIRAPVGGYVLERSVEPGQTVSQGSGVLFRMAKGGELELQAQLGETELAMISVGVPATVTPVGSDRQFNGTIWQIAPTINQQSRQGIARIALPFDRALKPGGFAAVEIKAGAVTAAVLPESAIQNDRDGSFVYIVNKQNKVQRRAVKTGIITQQGIAINEGLDGTERVVLYAGGFLNPDETVKPKLVKTAAQSAAR